MNTLLCFLMQPKLPLWKYCLATFPIALLPSAAIYSSAHFLLSAVGTDIGNLLPPSRAGTISEFVGAVVVAPIVETAVLGIALRAMLSLFNRPVLVATLSALLWGALHAAFGLLWFFGAAWSFFIFSCAYLAWKRMSGGEAFAAAAIPHALINFTGMAVVAINNAA